ncbi:MAG: hypothetical protein ACRBBS_17100 [Thalassovita sp.]
MTTTHRVTIDQVKGDRDWSALEQDLLDACELGRFAYLPGKQDCPKDQSDPDRRVRPALIRYLLEGGCDSPDGARPHPNGILLRGAWIDGLLVCHGCVSDLDLAMKSCLFENQVWFMDAKLGALHLIGSRAKQGLNLHRIKLQKSLFLRDGFHATGLVNLGGARIDGQLSCRSGRFDGDGGKALYCNAARIGSTAVLDKGFHATGLVDFGGAQIGRNFGAVKAKFEGDVNLNGAKIEGLLVWQEIEGEIPFLDLGYAAAGVLQDDLFSWERAKRFDISGFTYERLSGTMLPHQRLTILRRNLNWPIQPSVGEEVDTPTGKPKRPLPWIRGAGKADFDPQPYTQLAKVLEDDGNRAEAARVHYQKEKSLRLAAWRRAHMHLDGTVGAGVRSILMDLRRVLDAGFCWMFGYGHQPVRALGWMLAIWAFGFWLYGAAYGAGQMVPNSDVILTSAAWLDAATPFFAGDTSTPPALAWVETPAGRDYETFSAGLYALDLFVPLDALGQETTWAPSKAYGGLGTFAYWARMPIQLLGWIITAVGAAVLTGLIGRKD